MLAELPLEGADGCWELQVWADCGPHFRSYEFLYNLSELCRTRFHVVVQNYYAEHHGKGRCDGSFALQRRWISDFARQRNIESLADMKAALQQGAEETIALDPPPHGPSYYIRDFVPQKQNVCRKLDNTGTGFQIEYSYCVLFERAADRIRGWNFWYSDRCHDRRLGESIGQVVCSESPASEDWRMSYRTSKPEKTPLNVSLLNRRREKQEAFMRGTDFAACSRRDSFVQALVRREKQAASSKAKYVRRKRALAVNLREAANSSDSDSDSSSAA